MRWPRWAAVATWREEVPSGDGGPSPLLDVDGLSGPKTQGAIQKFQLKHFGWKGADSRIDPGHQTLAKLNEVLHRGGASPALGFGGAGSGILALRTGPQRLEYVRTLFPEVQGCVRLARFHLTMATPFIAQSSGAAGSLAAGPSLRLVSHHFALEKLPSSARRAALGAVAAVYDTMLMVFARPGGLWGPYAFDYDSDPNLPPKAQAYTHTGGFFRSGEKDGDHRLDAIYLLDQFDRMPRERNLRNIVHELGHFVGPKERGSSVTDLAYGWFDEKTRLHGAPRAMSQLTPDERMRNAESYANFAYEAKFGDRPPGTL